MTSNIDPQSIQANRSDGEIAMGKLVTDSVAAVIDESRRRGEPSITLDDLTDRLALQFHNVPGFDDANFRSRANASAKVAELQGGQADRGTRRLDESARRAEQSQRKAG